MVKSPVGPWLFAIAAVSSGYADDPENISTTVPRIEIVGEETLAISQSSMEDYDVIRPLGRGRYADMVLVQDKITGAKFAYKVPHNDKEAQAHLNEEVAVMKALSHYSENRGRHPNLVYMHKYIINEDGSPHSILMEYCEFGNLASQMKVKTKQQWNRAQKRYLFFQIMDAVRYMHRRGISHRDINLENIFLCGSGGQIHGKIGDFGSATRETSGFHSYSAPEYMPPETASSSTWNYRMADIWASGIVYFFMLTGHFPVVSMDLLNKGIKYKEEWLLLGGETADDNAYSLKDEGLSKTDIVFLQGILHVNPIMRWTAYSTLQNEYFFEVYPGIDVPKTPKRITYEQ